MKNRICIALVANLLFIPGAVAQVAKPPVEAFGQLPSLSQPSMSPDGNHVAVIRNINGRPGIVFYNMSKPDDPNPRTFTSDKWLIAGITWANNDRLIVTLKSDLKVHEATVRAWYRAISISATKDGVVYLFKDQEDANINLNTSGVADIDLDDPDHVFIPLILNSAGWKNLMMKVDVNTGTSEMAASGLDKTSAWYMDGHGHPVARVDSDYGPLIDYLLVYDGKAWHKIAQSDATADNGLGVYGVSEDGKWIIGTVVKDGHDAIAKIDMQTGKPGEILLSDPRYDANTALYDEWTGRVIGGAFVADGYQIRYFDEARNGLQRGLEAAFPGVQVTVVTVDQAADKMIVATESPRQPRTYYYLDRKTHQASLFANAYPDLTAADLGEMKSYPYKARDGLDIPAYITLPPGRNAKNLPVVVMPHGGPDARDSLGFDWWAQFLANRGYLVLQPNYRGSSGYGKDFTKAGLHEWGLKMQDDITDGVKKLIADGIADPNRICIVGASYGGYAALAGATFTPDLYKCAVAVAGVSDLGDMMRREENNHGRGSSTVSFWESRIGLHYGDSARLDATSPAKHADRIKIPVLLLHGKKDSTVVVEQSEEMRDAMVDARKDVQLIEFDSDDHYFTLAATRIQMLTEIEKFLDKNIGH